MNKYILLILVLISTIYCTAQIQLLNDEFDDASTLSNWLNIDDVEGWNADHLEDYNINTSQTGKLMMLPYTSSWYQDYRGSILFKELTGDFILTTEATATNRAGNGNPSSSYSLAGLMIRTPRSFTNGAAGWTPYGENFIFLATGHATGSSANAHLEVKTTVSGSSNLAITPIPSPTNVRIRIARIGEYVICLYQLPGGSWIVHRRFDRSDFPNTMQIGFVTYTDWPKVSSYTPIFHNSNVLNANLNPDPTAGVPFTPDIIGGFEFARFDEVNLPPILVGVNLTNSAVTDAQLLSFLGFTSQPYTPAAYVELQVNLFLSGPYNPTTQLMSDDLRIGGLIPSTQPYNTAPWTYEGMEQLGPGVLNSSNNDAIVDWVLVELRDKNNPQNILYRAAGLLQRDGDVVSAQDGVSPLRFNNISSDDFYVSVKHRNHLGCMSQNTFTLSAVPALVDFSTIATYGQDAQNTLGTIQAQWSGNADTDNVISAGDRSVTWNSRNQNGYLNADCNLDRICNAADRSLTWNTRNRTAQLP